MLLKFSKIALGIVLAAASISASAQKTYTSGLVTLGTTIMGQPVQTRLYFTTDSSLLIGALGPATFKTLTNVNYTFAAILVDVPAKSLKKVVINTADEIEQELDAMPRFKFFSTFDNKQISGFNCRRVEATDANTGKKYDVWVTNDVVLPPNAAAPYFKNIGGYPIQYISFAYGRESLVTVLTISRENAPAGSFSISDKYDKITSEELKALMGGN